MAMSSRLQAYQMIANGACPFEERGSCSLATELAENGVRRSLVPLVAID